MMPGIPCNPSDHPTWSQLKEHCDERHEGDMRWAQEVVKTSVQDRERLHRDVDELHSLIPRFQWWFIGILVVIILSNIIGPRYFGKNGYDKQIGELKGYIAEVAGVVEDQQSLIIIGNKISEDNKVKLDRLEKRLK